MTEEDLYTAEDAALEVGIAASTIRVWRHRGFITPAGKRGRVLLFRLGDVFECESKRKRKHRRRT